jgi:hypothetical protein
VYALGRAGITDFNSGAITTTGDGGVGILTNGGTTTSITNTGSITTSGGITTDGSTTIQSNGIWAVSKSGPIAIDNQGTISTSGSTASGIVVESGSGVISFGLVDGTGGPISITNSGTIAATGANGYAILVRAGASPVTIDNSGSITGDLDMGSSDATLILHGGWALNGIATGGAGNDTLRLAAPTGTTPYEMTGGSFTSFETTNFTGGTVAISGAFDSALNVQSGHVFGRTGSTLTGNVSVASGGTFGSAGTVVGDVSVGSGGTLSPGASPAVMTVVGNVALAGGSVTTFEFVPAPGQSDQILIDGTLAIASGATINLTGNRPLTPGSAYDMIVADSISGTFTVGTWDRSAVQGFLRYTPTRLQLLGTFVAPSNVSAQTGAAIDYVNSLFVSGQAGAAVLGSIASLLDGNGLASAGAFGQLTPEAYASASQLGVEQGLSIAKAARTGAAASARSEAGLYSFAQGLGDWRKLKGDSGTGVSRASSHSYGMLGGIGYGSEAGSIGAFVGYLDSRQRIAGLGARTKADGVIAGVSGHFATAGFDLNALVAYDWSDANTRRSVPGNVDVSSKYDLRSLILDASAGYSVPVSGGWAVRPELGITHVSTRRGAATETGSAAFAFAVDRDRTKATFVDGALSLRGGQAAGDIFQPWIQLGVRHQLEGEVSFASAGFLGTTARLTVLGAGRKETLATAGVGFSVEATHGLRLFASYQGEFGGGNGNSLNAGIRFAF